MERLESMRMIAGALGIMGEKRDLIAQYTKEKKDLSDAEFYKNLNSDLPFINEFYKYRTFMLLRSIKSILQFYFVLTIISLIALLIWLTS